MAKINLLPWRADLRKERQKEFAIMMGVSAVFAIAVWGMIHFYHVQLIDNQKGRNKYLEEQIVLLDKKIAEVKQLEAERQRLIDKMRAIEQLQSHRPLIVRLFDELVTTLPEGLSLLTLTQKGNTVIINGVAQSNGRVSSYMRNIENSQVIKDPKLQVIQGKQEGGQRISSFSMIFNQIIPKPSDGSGP